MFSQPGEDVAGALQGDGEVAILFLYLLVGVTGGGVVGYGTAHDDDVLLGAARGDGLEHLLSADDRNDLNALKRCDSNGTRHQCHLGASQHGHLRQGIAHLAGGVVGDIAHRVDGLLRRTCRDQQFLALQVFLLGQMEEDMLQQYLFGGHLATADIATGQTTFNGFYNMVSVVLQFLDVIL